MEELFDQDPPVSFGQIREDLANFLVRSNAAFLFDQRNTGGRELLGFGANIELALARDGMPCLQIFDAESGIEDQFAIVDQTEGTAGLFEAGPAGQLRIEIDVKLSNHMLRWPVRTSAIP